VAVIISEKAFFPYQELQNYQQKDNAGKYGATTIFVGTMRDFNLGDTVTRMTLEYYPGMTERRLQQIIEEASLRWNLVDALVIHRVGDIIPDDTIVLVAAWASHRGAAFDASRYIVENLKHTAPFWKKETLTTGDRWVESNTDGSEVALLKA
jgi:molybdopterin synthase catalytic subunit